ncbi:MAG: biopolymer transporter ExbD [Verrucomicrobia bacterium]|nr:biopolymer transporter ExbD [Verrucomicrobiota bacterium]
MELTPMIDVVFLLLVFFVFAIEPADVLARLDVSRPAVSETPVPKLSLLKIDVLPDAYAINGQRYSLANLGPRLARWAQYDSDASVQIVCDVRSSHAVLVELLDLCQQHQLENIALFSR